MTVFVHTLRVNGFQCYLTFKGVITFTAIQLIFLGEI